MALSVDALNFDIFKTSNQDPAKNKGFLIERHLSLATHARFESGDGDYRATAENLGSRKETKLGPLLERRWGLENGRAWVDTTKQPKVLDVKVDLRLVDMRNQPIVSLAGANMARLVVTLTARKGKRQFK
ncbi:unnamed protein product [Protopolystoma xenopodis]|uniref:Uncharacterized protein n=1 Tax=Protopolystoma xenopodis TaxID=117903 RepID=A0A448XL08_9PLAT|nr:unnamed protein product [Protopolystoma xenopodis]